MSIDKAIGDPIIRLTETDARWQSPACLGALPVPGGFYALECIGVHLQQDVNGQVHRVADFALRRVAATTTKRE